MKEVYIVNCCRTAIGSFGGSFKDIPSAGLGAIHYQLINIQK